jgi:hypothetical protein
MAQIRTKTHDVCLGSAAGIFLWGFPSCHLCVFIYLEDKAPTCDLHRHGYFWTKGEKMEGRNNLHDRFLKKFKYYCMKNSKDTLQNIQNTPIGFSAAGI